MTQFQHTTARIAAWNFAGFNGISEKRVERQVEGLALLDAAVIALVEITPSFSLEATKERSGRENCFSRRKVCSPQAPIEPGLRLLTSKSVGLLSRRRL